MFTAFLLQFNNKRWQQGGIIASIFLLVILFSVGATNSQRLYLIAAIAGIGIAASFFRWPPLALLVAMIGGMYVEYSGPSGINIAIVIVAYITGMWILSTIQRRALGAFASSKATFALAVFLIVSILAMIGGGLPWFTGITGAPLGAQFAGFSIVLCSIGAFIVAADQIRQIYWLQTITWAFLVLATVYLMGRIIPGLAILSNLYHPSSTGSIFWAWLAAIAYSQLLFNRRLSLAHRGFLLLVVLATFYVAFGQSRQWQSGWIPPAVAVAVLTFLRSWRIGIALMAISAMPMANLFSEQLALDVYSYTTRIDAWIIMEQIIRVNPLLGLGFANYRWYTPLFSIRGFDVSFNSHNQYIDIIAQTGLLGMLCLIWFFIAIGKVGWQLKQTAPDGFAKAYAYGCLGGLIATIVSGILGDWFLPYFYNIGMKGFRSSAWAWIFLGGLLALRTIVIHQTPEQSVDSSRHD